MPLKEENYASLRAMVDKFSCFHVDTSEDFDEGDPPEAEAPDGYYTFKVGPTRNKAEPPKDIANVQWTSNAARDFREVVDIVEVLLADEEGHVFVLAYRRGKSSVCGATKCEGTVANRALSVRAKDRDAAMAGMAAELNVTMQMLRDHTDALLASNRNMLPFITELYASHELQAAELVARAGQDRTEAMREALREVMPTLQAVLPMAVAGWAASQGANVEKAPEEPGAAFQFHGARVAAEAQAIAKLFNDHPEAITPERVAMLQGLHGQLGAFIAQAAAAAEQGEEGASGA